MLYPRLNALLSDKAVFQDFVSSLPVGDDEKGIGPGESVADFHIEMLLDAFQKVAPRNAGHIDILKGVNDSDGKLNRFFLLTIIPESAACHNDNLAFIHFNKQLVYFAWAANRIIEAHSNTLLTVTYQETEKAIATIPLHWKYVYIGNQPFRGTTHVKTHFPEDKEESKLSVNFADLMRIDRTPTIEKVLEAYKDDVEGNRES